MSARQGVPLFLTALLCTALLASSGAARTPAESGGEAGSAEPAADEAHEGPSLREFLAESEATWGITVYDASAGRTVYSHRADEAFRMHSLAKIPMALTALGDGAAAEDMAELIARSDDEAANALWGRYGGPGIIGDWADRIGMESTAGPQDPSWWGHSPTTADDVRRMLEHLLREAEPELADPVLTGMAATTDHGADGYYQHFGIPDGLADRDWAVKQGWSCCDLDRRWLNTAGIVEGEWIVVVLAHWPDRVTDVEAQEEISDVASRLDGFLVRETG
ncbi:serine hydrolase [Salininema proteolyticum]